MRPTNRDYTCNLSVELKHAITKHVSHKDVMSLCLVNKDWRMAIDRERRGVVYRDTYQALPGRTDEEHDSQFSASVVIMSDTRLSWKRRCLTELNWTLTRPITTASTTVIRADQIVDFKIDTKARQILVLLENPNVLQVRKIDDPSWILWQSRLSPHDRPLKLEYDKGYAAIQCNEYNLEVMRHGQAGEPMHSFQTTQIIQTDEIVSWAMHGKHVCVWSKPAAYSAYDITNPSSDPEFEFDGRSQHEYGSIAHSEGQSIIPIVKNTVSWIEVISHGADLTEIIRPWKTSPALYEAYVAVDEPVYFKAKSLLASMAPKVSHRRTFPLTISRLEADRMPVHEMQWRYVAVSGDLLVALSRCGRLYISTAWKEDTSPRARRHTAVMKLPVRARQEMLEGQLHVRCNRIACVARNKIFVVTLDDDLGVSEELSGFMIELDVQREVDGDKFSLQLLDDVLAYRVWEMNGWGSRLPALKILDFAPKRVW